MNTAPKPTARPATTRRVRRWRSHRAPISAVNSGVVAISSDASEPGSVRVANASSEKGIAENVAPTTTSRRACVRIASTRRGPRKTAMAAPASAIRISAVQMGPTSGAATRKNRKAAPQTAPRYTRETRSMTPIRDRPA